jgi:hypothetical protein
MTARDETRMKRTEGDDEDRRHEDRRSGRQRGAWIIGDQGWWVEGARSLLPLEHVVEVERVGSTCCWSLPLPVPAVRN